MPGRIAISTDRASGVVQVLGTGFWTPDLIATHFRKLEAEVARARAPSGTARVLVDLREAVVQTADSAETLSHWTDRVYRPADRVAVLCATMLVAMQVRRAAKVHQLDVFTDPEPALAWLLGDAPAGSAPAAAPESRAARRRHG